MLKITKRTEYALIALSYINSRNKITTSKEIAEKFSIPFENLSKILQFLAKSNIIKPIYGPNGGYRIKQNLAHVSLWKFIEIMEGPLGIADCIINYECNQSESCNIKTPINIINEKMKNMFTQISLNDVT